MNKQKVAEKVRYFSKRWFVDSFGGMGSGLFCTLIAGTILATLGGWINKINGGNLVGIWIINIANCAKTLMGAGIGAGIAYKLKGNSPLILFSAAVAGFIGAFAVTNTGVIDIFNPSFFADFKLGKCGNPIGAYVVTLAAVEIASLYAGKTKLDIILVPLGVLFISMAAIFLAWPLIMLVYYCGVGLQKLILLGTAAKYLTAIFIAVVMGILLTLPVTSSAAIWISIASAHPGSEAMLIAGGAAVAGCAAHMVGFAVTSFRENKWGGLIAQGLGTSMIQMPNIARNPRVMLPEIIASAIAGPVAVAFGLLCDATGGGMGTSGLVGVIQTISTSLDAGVAAWKVGVGTALALFIIPAGVSFLVSEIMRKKGAIKLGDMRLE